MASQDIDVFEPDLLDKAVIGYEENVPLPAQIAIGFTPPGIAADLGAATKYGRDAYRDFSQGSLGQGGVNLGIAALSGLAAVPFFGDLTKPGKSLLKGMNVKAADKLIDIKQINRPIDFSGKVIKSEDKRVQQAMDLLKKSSEEKMYKGVVQQKRQPIEVLQNADGTFQQLGGKSTLEALERSGVKRIPVKIFKSASDYNTYDFLRKRTKETKRYQDAMKMQPTAGNPTFEAPVREFGNKMEQQFKLNFNQHQIDITSAPQMFERAKRLNPEFQSQISKVADDLRLDQDFNPVGGKPLGDIDPETGFPVGEVKLIPRMVEKTMTKYGGDFSQITDPIRTRILVETPEQEIAVAKRIADLFPTVDGERVLMKKSGYLDRKLNIQFTGSNGEQIIGEVGILTRPMAEGAQQAHGLYEAFRMKDFGLPPGSSIADIEKEGLRLERAMNDIFQPKLKQIDPRFLEDVIEKFALGGYVFSGKSGRLSPITPNMFSNSDFDSLEPSIKKSFTTSGVASLQPTAGSITGIKYPKRAFSVPVMTAGDLSHEKYNVSIDSSLQKFTNNYNRKIVDIFEQ